MLCSVDDVDIAEQRDWTAVRNGIQLLWLALTVIERRSKSVCAFPAHKRQRIPKVRRARLIRDVAKHSNALAVLNFPKHLTAELKVVALLIDGIRTVALDIDTVLGCGHDLVFADVLRIRLQADVRHS